MRSALVAALVARAENSLKARVRRFLRGLSSDELQFIASFLGGCILESTGSPHRFESISRGLSALQGQGLADCQSQDRDLKVILLREYLCRRGAQQIFLPERSEARSA